MNCEIRDPVSPPINLCPAGQADGPEFGWEKIEDSGLCEKNDPIEIDGAMSEGIEVQEPKCLPCPIAPSQREIDEHNLTHANYRSWCPWCVAGRRPNTQHRSQADQPPREVPALHLDYCFLGDEAEDDRQTALVGKIEPIGSTLFIPVDVKGP